MMSQVLTSEGVQYILNDSELIVDQPEIPENLNDIIYQDGSRTILVNGHFLQGDDDTFILNEEALGKIFITDTQDISNNEFDQTEFVQFIDDNCGISPLEEHQIFYINDEHSDFHFATADDIIAGENDQMTFETEVVDVNNFIKFDEIDESDLICSQSSFQYAILKDGKLHLQPCEEMSDDKLFHQVESEEEIASFSTVKNELVDVSCITGKNLLTGQKVTLDSYLGKIKKNLKNSDKKSSTADSVSRRKFLLNSLLNKKIKLGRTVNGKQLVGKIIQIRHKTDDKEVKSDDKRIDEIIKVEEPEDQQTSSPKSAELEPFPEIVKPQNVKGNKIIVSKSVPKETFSHISRTIEGLMSMDSVRKKLENKRVLVKVMEKQWMNDFQKYKRTISFISGHTCLDLRDGNSKWIFLNDTDNEDALKGTEENMKLFNRKKQPELETLTIIITYTKNKERQVKVILSQSKGIKCTICQKEFRSTLHLKTHMSIKHQEAPAESIVEKSCDETSENLENVDRDASLRVTPEDNETNFMSDQLECYVCFDRFPNQILLHEHLCTHINGQYCCEICGEGFIDLRDFISHQKTHTTSRYVCDICNRTFSRQSNLYRHKEIHKGVGNMYECDVCGCSYHFISSLTRHVVQNHLKH